MSNSVTRLGRSFTLSALGLGLVVGFIVGREMGPRGPAAVPDRSPTAERTPGKVYRSEAEFPAGWLKSADLASVAGIDFAGATEAQKAAAMQVLNEHDCECGCGMGSVALCAKKDPNCPRSPKLAKEIVDLARQGKGVGELAAHLDRANPKKAAGPPSAAAPQAARRIAIPAHSPRRGPVHAKVTIVEFSDFQCPFCGTVPPLVDEVLKAYPKDVAFVFINYPLRSMHPHAAGAALAFVAAQRQGKGWPMHDKLFANQRALTPDDLDRYARELRLDLTRFKKDLGDPAVARVLTEDEALAASAGVSGTPAIFINGRQPPGRDFPGWKGVIDEEIEKADRLLAGGTRPERLYDRLTELAAAEPPAARPAPPEKVELAIGESPVKGAAQGPVTIVAFSDFQCPYCSRAVPGLQEVEDHYRGKVRIVFKHLPLPFHDKAELAAEAATAAQEQGKFWPFHDKLFANQQQLDRPSLERYAQELGLDLARFRAALDSGKYRKRVQEDAQLGRQVGVTGTPAFFVNGKMHMGAMSFDEWRPIVDGALASAR